MILSRIRALPEPVVEIIRIAAVVGRDVADGLVSSITDAPPHIVSAAVRVAVEQNILVATRRDGLDSYYFRHALLREAVLDDVLPRDRRAIHAAMPKRWKSGPSSPAETNWSRRSPWLDTGSAQGSPSGLDPPCSGQRSRLRPPTHFAKQTISTRKQSESRRSGRRARRQVDGVSPARWVGTDFGIRSNCDGEPEKPRVSPDRQRVLSIEFVRLSPWNRRMVCASRCSTNAWRASSGTPVMWMPASPTTTSPLTLRHQNLRLSELGS